MMAAILASIAPPLADTMKLRIDPTSGARELGSAVAHIHDLVQTGSIVGVFGLELFEGEMRHDRYLR